MFNADAVKSKNCDVSSRATIPRQRHHPAANRIDIAQASGPHLPTSRASAASPTRKYGPAKSTRAKETKIRSESTNGLSRRAVDPKMVSAKVPAAALSAVPAMNAAAS